VEARPRELTLDSKVLSPVGKQACVHDRLHRRRLHRSQNNHNELAVAVRETVEPANIARDFTLFQIEESLVLLAEAAVAEGLTPEIEQALVKYLEGAVEKRDRVAGFIRFCEAMESLAKDEVKRMRVRGKHFKAIGGNG
jgi:hypothetical protein